MTLTQQQDMTEAKMEVGRIRKLASAIEKQPHVAPSADKGFNMWGYNHPCGTPSCIAGWAIYKFKSTRPGPFETKHDHAARILNLDDRRALRLFDPEHYGSMEDMRQVTPNHAAAVLRHLADTGEVDWSVGAHEKEA